MLLADANARLGDTVSECVGDLAAEEELLAGNLFHTFLLQVGAFAPSTFPSCHKGPSGTWRAPHGEWYRIDYILVPFAWNRFHHDSSVIEDFDVLQLRDRP